MYGPRQLSLYARIHRRTGRAAQRVAHIKLLTTRRLLEAGEFAAQRGSDAHGVCRRARVTRLQCLSLIALGLLALELANVSRAHRRAADAAVSWRERDFAVYFQAYQMFQRPPEELSEWQQDEVKRWCRFLAVNCKYDEGGVENLSNDEYRFVVEVLSERSLAVQAVYSAVGEACRLRLAGEDELPVVEQSEG